MWSILTFAASGFGLWALLKYVILTDIRIDSTTYKTLYDISKSDRKIMIDEEFVSSENKKPISYVCFCLFKNAPWFYLSHSERLLTSYPGKDQVSRIVCFRWKRKHVIEYLRTTVKKMQFDIFGIPVELMLPHYVDKIGSVKEKMPEPIVKEHLWKDFDNEVAEVVEGKRNKTSALLYGKPGNGKTSLAKYLATKYQLPIMIFTLNPDWSNHELLLMFSQIPNKCIVLFEDFDNYFDKRKCILGDGNKQIKFTFDIILNGLDGVYTSYENVVFIMTANDIEKVDSALKNRPSRFKYVRCFDNPCLETRKKILNEQWAEKSAGLNLDQVFRLKEFHAQGNDYATAAKRLDIETKGSVQERAFYRWEERMRDNIDGDHSSDWEYANAA